MYTEYTYQDWLKNGRSYDFAFQVVRSYKASTDFEKAIEAQHYFDGDNVTVGQKYILKANTVWATNKETGRTTRRLQHNSVVGNRLANGFFTRAVMQQNQFLLGNGVRLADQAQKDLLGATFDKMLEALGENALVQGVAWGFWNFDHLEVIQAAKDDYSGFVALLDEMTGDPMTGIQFWQLSSKRNLYLRLFELDGVTVLVENNGKVEVLENKRPYIKRAFRDGAGEINMEGQNYSALPVVPLYANKQKRSELTQPIKSKIDCYDRIASDFADNLDRANDVYWVLTNFSGGTPEVLEMLEQINKIKAVINNGDGIGNASAEARTIEVPYEARKTALELLRSALFEDFMALDMHSITGGSLTNVAIEAATADLNMKANAYEWQVFTFVQKVMALIGIHTEDIKFRRQSITNANEIVEAIYMTGGDLPRRKRLELNPYINEDEIETLMRELEAEKTSEVADTNREVQKQSP